MKRMSPARLVINNSGQGIGWQVNASGVGTTGVKIEIGEKKAGLLGSLISMLRRLLTPSG